MGPSYRFNVITPSALSDPAYLLKSEVAFNDNQSGILTNSGGDFLGIVFVHTLLYSRNPCLQSCFPCPPRN